MLILFDEMIADMLSNKKLTLIVTELFIKGRKLNISLVFYHKILFRYSRKYQTEFNTLFCDENSKQKRPSKTAFNYSSDIDFQDFMNLYKKRTARPYSFLVIDASLAPVDF